MQERAKPVAAAAEPRRAGAFENARQKSARRQGRKSPRQGLAAHRHSGRIRSAALPSASRRLLIHSDPPLCREARYGIVRIEPLATAGEEVRVARRIVTALARDGAGIWRHSGSRCAFTWAAKPKIASLRAKRAGIAELRSPLPKAGFPRLPARLLLEQPKQSPARSSTMPWERLYDYWTEVISGEKRMVERLSPIPTARRFVYIQHSPDFPLSRHRHGRVRARSDRIGRASRSTADLATAITISQKNRKRVVKWLALLRESGSTDDPVACSMIGSRRSCNRGARPHPQGLRGGSNRRPASAPSRAARSSARRMRPGGGKGLAARRLQQHDAARPQYDHQDQAGDKAADMRPERHAGPAGGDAEPADQLHREPQAEHRPGRDVDDAEKDHDPDKAAHIRAGWSRR